MHKSPCPATGLYLLDIKPISSRWLWWFKVTDRIVACCDKSSKFLPYQLSMVVYWTTMALTGNGELGFDSGEGAWETATTTTVRQQGRKLANPNSGSQWQEIASWETKFLRHWNENSVNLLARNNWRASHGASSRGNSSSNSVY